MINRYSIGFVAVAGLAVAGVDYSEQSKRADLALGQMSLMTYVDTVPQRINASKAESAAALAERDRKSAWRGGGVQYLPEAPEGWTRRSLLEGDDSAIMPAPDETEGAGAGESFLEKMEAEEDAKQYAKRAERSYVYERGTETVFVEVKLREQLNSNSITGLVGTMVNNSDFGFTESTLGFNTIGGVGFVENLFMGGRKHHYRVLEGRIGFGAEVNLLVHANAGSEGTNEILSAIDYDGLNNLLPTPMELVGNDAIIPEGADPAEFALALDELYDEFMLLRSREAEYRISNIDTNALVFNTYAENIGAGAAMRDITGGQDMDLGMLIDFAYRTAASAFRSGKSAAEVKADVTRLVETAVTLADAEAAAMVNMAEGAPAPAMSPELAAELGLDAPAPSQASEVFAEDETPRPASADMDTQALMQIDPVATEAAGGHVISMALDADTLAQIRAGQGTSEAEMELALMVASRTFEARHNIPAESCGFVAANHRLECDATPKKPASGTMGLVSKATDSGKSAPKSRQTGEKPKRLELSNSGGSSGNRCVGSFCN